MLCTNLYGMNKELLVRAWSSGWNNFKRNRYVSFGTTGVMVLVLMLFLGLITLNVLASSVVASIDGKVDVSVYFKTDATDEEMNKVKSDLQALDTVSTVIYVSRDEALADFKSKHAGDALIQESLAELDANPLQASLNIKAKDASQYASIVGFLEGHKFRTIMDKINFYENEQVIKRIENISRSLQDGGFIATIILACIAVLVTFNTIRLTIYNQKQEIEIMRLVGGSNWYIRAPYLVEGALYGSMAALTALVLFYPVVFAISPKLQGLIPSISLSAYFTGHVLKISSLLFVVGIMLGVVSSLVAIRRFLKI